MAHQFVQNPAQGQLDTLSNGRVFQFNGGKWDLFTNTLPQNVSPSISVIPNPPIVSDTAPALPNANPFWFKSTENALYLQKTVNGVTSWVRAVEAAAMSPLESETAPALPNANPFWFKPSTSILHYQYNDGNSIQWLEV
jgi:hypothetical protein